MKTYILLILCLCVMLSGCEDNPPEDQLTSKPYEGQQIIVIVPTLHAGLIRGPVMEQAKVFEEMTGAKIRVVTPGWNETIEKTKQSLTDPHLNYDIFVVIAMWNGMLLGGDHIEAVPQWVKDKIDWDDVLPIYKNSVLSHKSIAYGMPYDGDCINLYYRKDIFEDEKIRQRFKSKYNFELAPPKTWVEYKKIADFFTGWDWDKDGKNEYGNAILRKKGDIAMLQFLATAGAYAKHPVDKTYLFEQTSLASKINSPAFVKALQDYIEVVQYAPEGALNFAGHDVRNSFVTGEVAMAIDWADLGIYAAENKISQLTGEQVGYAQIPGSNQVYNFKEKRWDEQYNQVSSISGNWSFFVNKKSQNKKLAFEFAAHMTSKKMTKNLVAKSGNAVNPSRFSHFKDYESWTQSGFTVESAKRYLEAISNSLTNKNAVHDITLPGAGRYYQALDEAVYLAVKGELSPQGALNLAANEWEKITEDIGRSSQLEYYTDSLK